MLNRLSLEMHWIGFIISALFAVFFIAALAINLTDSAIDADTIGAFAQLAYYTFALL